MRSSRSRKTKQRKYHDKAIQSLSLMSIDAYRDFTFRIDGDWGEILLFQKSP